ncbi:transposase [Lactobacillus sp. M0403]|uniref:transposase n=2 Tax=Lactobacillus TaxID=1578 RepID=UPI00164F5CB5|nr:MULTISPECIES: transposase [Lactobacillus]MBC6361132.1 transposase [Lactobacillus apis]MBI0092692.1 transposase [Lactobacillus sp. M0403]
MSKLSKQDKIEIYHLWHDYQIGSIELSQRYRVGKSNISYLLALIDRHGLAILNQPFTTYTSNFKEQALKRIVVNHEPLYYVALEKL